MLRWTFYFTEDSISKNNKQSAIRKYCDSSFSRRIRSKSYSTRRQLFCSNYRNCHNVIIMKITKIISFIFILFLLNSNIVHLYAGSNSIQIDLGVNGCNNNGICEPSTGETSLSCPVDCAVVTPPPSPSRGGGGYYTQENIYLYNLSMNQFPLM